MDGVIDENTTPRRFLTLEQAAARIAAGELVEGTGDDH
jgi:hypothetical protein